MWSQSAQRCAIAHPAWPALPCCGLAHGGGGSAWLFVCVRWLRLLFCASQRGDDRCAVGRTPVGPQRDKGILRAEAQAGGAAARGGRQGLLTCRGYGGWRCKPQGGRGRPAGLGCDAVRRPMRQYNPAASPCGPIAACVARTLPSCIPHSIVMLRCSIMCCFIQLYVASLRSPLVQRQVAEAFRSREAAEWERRTEEVTPCVRACACAHAGVRARARSSSGMGWERNAFCAFARTCV